MLVSKTPYSVCVYVCAPLNSFRQHFQFVFKYATVYPNHFHVILVSLCVSWGVKRNKQCQFGNEKCEGKHYLETSGSFLVSIWRAFGECARFIQDNRQTWFIYSNFLMLGNRDSGEQFWFRFWDILIWFQGKNGCWFKLRADTVYHGPCFPMSRISHYYSQITKHSLGKC